MAHQLDGLVLVPNCDKIVPGMVMAAVRMDVPAVVCSGGPMLEMCIRDSTRSLSLDNRGQRPFLLKKKLPGNV